MDRFLQVVEIYEIVRNKGLVKIGYRVIVKCGVAKDNIFETKCAVESGENG